MKRNVLNILLFISICCLFNSCLKDKGFENHEYGINDPDESENGVGFPWAYNPEPRLLSVDAVTTSQTLEAPTILLLTGDPAPTDLHVNLVANPSLVAAYNADPANANKQMSTFPAGAYTIPNLKVTIPAGKRVGVLKITIPTTTGLSFSDIYGLGFTIQSVDEAGYKLAENLKNVIIGINVANQYAGSYRVTGYFFHPSSPRAIDDHKELTTKSATGCIAPHSDLYGSNYYFEFDVAQNNTLTNYMARGATPPPPSSGFMTTDIPNPGSLNPYPSGGDQFPGAGEWKHSKYNNTYDVTNRTFLMHYGYGVGSTSQSGYTRQVYEKWVKE
jgi:Domain of unknown function (DUF1735)